MIIDDKTILITIRPTAEVTIKAARTRANFLRKLRQAIKDALKRASLQAEVKVRGNRILARIESTNGTAERYEAEEALGCVFGIGSFSFLEGRCAAELDEIVRMGTELYHERVQGKTYAVRCKRNGDHSFSSMEIERALGAALNEGAKVDLSNPEVKVEVEIEQDNAWFFCSRHRGPGGLPPGTGGNALALLSGGFDSIVGAWQLMKRGVQVDFVHFRLGELPSEGIALEVAKVMTDNWALGSRPEAHVVDLRGAMDEMRQYVAQNLWQVSLKRLMVKAADRVADALEERSAGKSRGGGKTIDALITGEAVGQVSSQTLSNLRSIDAAARRLVLRPLIGLDKSEIIALAEYIGTARLSAVAIEECNITPVKPATRSRVERLEEEEEGMEYRALEGELERVRSGESALALRTWQFGEGMLPMRELTEEEKAMLVSELPEGSVLLDCRPRHMRIWRPEWPAVVVEGERLERGRVYVAFCPKGIRSLLASNRLREEGYEVYNYQGGTAALREYLENKKT